MGNVGSGNLSTVPYAPKRWLTCALGPVSPRDVRHWKGAFQRKVLRLCTVGCYCRDTHKDRVWTLTRSLFQWPAVPTGLVGDSPRAHEPEGTGPASTSESSRRGGQPPPPSTDDTDSWTAGCSSAWALGTECVGDPRQAAVLSQGDVCLRDGAEGSPEAGTWPAGSTMILNASQTSQSRQHRRLARTSPA